MQTLSIKLLTLIFNLCMIIVSHAERILFLAPVATKSHKVAFMPIVEALAERGHQVTLVNPFESKKKEIRNIHEIALGDYYEERDIKWFEFQTKSTLSQVWGWMEEFRWFNIEGYKRLMASKEFKRVLDKKEVDLVIVDACVNDFTFPIVDYLQVPFISYIPSAGFAWTLDAMAVPPAYSYVPGGGSDHDSDMSFVERTINMFGMELFFWLRRYFVLGMVDDLVKNDFPNSRPIAEIERDAQLLLMNSHSTTTWSRPLPPYAIPIGPLHVRPAQPLPKVFLPQIFLFIY